MSVASNRRELLQAIKEHDHFFIVKELGSTILVNHRHYRTGNGFIIVPLATGFTARSTDGKLTAALKTVSNLLAQMEQHLPYP